MKKLTKSPLLILAMGILLLGFSNCDKILPSFDIESPFSTNFILEIGEDDDLNHYGEEIIDLSSNEEFNNNKDKIDHFTVKEVYYVVEDYEGEPGILGSGSVRFLDGSSQIGDAVSQSNVDYQALLNSGEETTIAISQETKDGIASTLKNSMKITIVSEGSVTDKPVYVDIKLYLVISANVKP